MEIKSRYSRNIGRHKKIRGRIYVGAYMSKPTNLGTVQNPENITGLIMH
jgi:hypothetical protein